VQNKTKIKFFSRFFAKQKSGKNVQNRKRSIKIGIFIGKKCYKSVFW